MAFEPATQRVPTSLGDITVQFKIFAVPRTRTVLDVNDNPVQQTDENDDFVFDEAGNPVYETEPVYGAASVQIPVIDQFGVELDIKKGGTENLTEEELTWLLTTGIQAKTRWAGEIILPPEE